MNKIYFKIQANPGNSITTYNKELRYRGRMPKQVETGIVHSAFDFLENRYGSHLYHFILVLSIKMYMYI